MRPRSFALKAVSDPAFVRIHVLLATALLRLHLHSRHTRQVLFNPRIGSGRINEEAGDMNSEKEYFSFDPPFEKCNKNWLRQHQACTWVKAIPSLPFGYICNVLDHPAACKGPSRSDSSLASRGLMSRSELQSLVDTGAEGALDWQPLC